MLTREQILEAVKAGRKSDSLDSRDYGRLVDFFPAEDYETFGFKLKDDADPSKIGTREWTRENVLAQLASDVSFGFEKALGKRGLSASAMHAVVKMWMWVLEDDELHDSADGLYAQYGLPFLKAVAIKYELPNEIGDNDGDEFKYSMEGDNDEDYRGA